MCVCVCVCELGASSRRRSGQQARKRPAGVSGTAWHFTGTSPLPWQPHLLTTVCVCVVACRWVPSSARFVALGSYPRNTGSLQVFQLQGNSLQKVLEAEKGASFKCGTFGASGIAERHLATGDFGGMLKVRVSCVCL